MNKMDLKAESHYGSKGFSLLELMVSLTVMLIVSAATLSALSYSQRIFVSQQSQADMHSGLRAAFESMTQEIGQAGALNFGPQTITAAVTGSTSAQTISVSSTNGAYVGMLLTVGTGSTQEVVTITAVPSSNTISGIFKQSRAVGTPIVARGVFPQGVLSGSTSTSMSLFGDINADGSLIYIQYDCDTNAGTLSRSATTLAPGVTTRAASVILLNNLVANPDGTPCFQYGASVTASGYTFIPSVAVSLTVRTSQRDPQTNAYVTMTKSFSNLSSRNVLAGLAMAQASPAITNRLQPTPPGLPLGP